MQEADSFVDVTEAGRRLGVSISTVWRMIRRGDLPSIRKRGRRLVPREALTSAARARQKAQVPPFGPDHPIFRLAGAGRSGGKLPGARDKHAILNQ
jgi:excisionase family DNA binding protein